MPFTVFCLALPPPPLPSSFSHSCSLSFSYTKDSVTLYGYQYWLVWQCICNEMLSMPNCFQWNFWCENMLLKYTSYTKKTATHSRHPVIEHRVKHQVVRSVLTQTWVQFASTLLDKNSRHLLIHSPQIVKGMIFFQYKYLKFILNKKMTRFNHFPLCIFAFLFALKLSPVSRNRRRSLEITKVCIVYSFQQKLVSTLI